MKTNFKGFLAYFLVVAMLLVNPVICNAASVLSVSISELVLPDDSVSEEVYLMDIMTFNGGESYVGVFFDSEDYEYYYGSSEDLCNWNLTAPKFSVAYGNGIFAGLLYEDGQRILNYTDDGGVTWNTVDVLDDISPYSIKFENGLFKLYGYDSNDELHLCISPDAQNWMDITEDLQGAYSVHRTIVVDGEVYCLVNGETGFSIIKSEAPDSSNTFMDWSNIASLQKNGYSMLDFYFDGKDVGVMLYSIAEYEANNISEYVYYVTTDFVNWDEKYWKEEHADYYTYDCSSTESYDTSIGEHVKAEIYPYTYYGSTQEPTPQKIVFSYDETEWTMEDIVIYLNGEAINKVGLSEDFVVDDGVIFNEDKTVLIRYIADSSRDMYTVPDGVTTIGEYAFYECNNLKTVTIGNDVESIGYDAFEYCKALTNVEISESVEIIGNYAFYGCDNLSKVTILSSDVSIGNFAFSKSWVAEVNPACIYGYAGSTAMEYALYHNAPFVSIVQCADTQNYLLPSEQYAVPADAVFSVTEIEDDDVATEVIAAFGEEAEYQLLDISLFQDDEPIQPNASVTVSLVVPAGLNGKHCSVYRCEDDNSFTDMDAEYKDGKLVFETEHFSTYAIVDDITVEPGDVDENGDINIRDAAYILQYIAGWNVEINLDVADVDNVNGVNIRDAALILQYIAGWNVTLG